MFLRFGPTQWVQWLSDERQASSGARNVESPCSKRNSTVSAVQVLACASDCLGSLHKHTIFQVSYNSTYYRYPRICRWIHMRGRCSLTQGPKDCARLSQSWSSWWKTTTVWLERSQKPSSLVPVPWQSLRRSQKIAQRHSDAYLQWTKRRRNVVLLLESFGYVPRYSSYGAWGLRSNHNSQERGKCHHQGSKASKQ